MRSLVICVWGKGERGKGGELFFVVYFGFGLLCLFFSSFVIKCCLVEEGVNLCESFVCFLLGFLQVW